MAKFRKKIVIVEATRWFKNGDHPDDGGSEKEGVVVRYFRHPYVSGGKICDHCRNKMFAHGWIDTFEGGHTVCPGDWIITDGEGQKYPCRADVFKATYEPINSGGTI